jgi:aspartyl aminopeptidase
MDLLTYINKSPCSFLAVENIKNILLEKGYEHLKENQNWNLRVGGKYFVTRNSSSLMAFRIPDSNFSGFAIGAAHDESPSYKVKFNAEIRNQDYVRLAVEPYGGMIAESWLDRPLSAAGRLIVKDGEKLVSKIVNIDKDLLIIPSVAIHLMHKNKENKNLNPAVDMLPLYGMEGYGVDFLAEVADAAGVSKGDIVAFDLFLYNRMPAIRWGYEGCFLSAPRIDDLVCVYAAMTGFLSAETNFSSVPVLAIFDNEEVGSATKQGACSTFLADTLQRINFAFGKEKDYCRRIAGSFLISADNGHALHPNHPELSDSSHAPVLNGGIVIKHNAAQHYCTDGVSDAVFRLLCRDAHVPCQVYYNRADIKGGATLGNLSNTKVSLNSIDIGLAQLAMHSAFETVGARDVERLCKVMGVFFGKNFAEYDELFGN